AARGKHRVEQLGRTRNCYRLTLGIGFGLLDRLFTLARSDSWLGLDLRALLERAQRGRLGIGRGLFLRERVELAGFRRDEKARLDDVGVSDAAPQPLEEIAALGRDLTRPAGFRISRAKPLGDTSDRLRLAVGI